MKKYILMTFGVNGVGGGQLYIKNKAQYIEEKGYKVFILHYHDGDISINYLEKFKNDCFPELELNLLCLSKKRIEKSINKILKHIDYIDGDEIILESNILSISMWGEELAKRVNGKHIVFSLSEKNPIDESIIKYTEYKYMRRELATINPKSFEKLYEKSNVVPDCGVKKLTAFLGDPVEDCKSPEIDNLELKEKNICVLGRMSKHYVLYSCAKISEYITKYPQVDFSLTVIGMKNEEVVSKINNLFTNCANVQVEFVDSLSPIPKKVFSMFDLIIGGAGCASLPYRQGALTLCMDVNTDKVLGLMGYDIEKSFSENHSAKSMEEYLDEALFTKDYQNREYTEPFIPTRDGCFAEHDDLIDKSDKVKEYFDFSKCPVSKKEKIKTVLYSIFGVKKVNRMLKFLSVFRH